MKVKQLYRFLIIVLGLISMPLFPLEGVTLPQRLRGVPFADNLGIILGTKIISIRGVDYPYNPTIIEYEEGYLLFFRQDFPKEGALHGYETYVGCVKLDRNFEQTQEEFFYLSLPSKSSEDPRVIRMGNELLLVYNAPIDGKSKYRICRCLCLAVLDYETLAVKYVTALDRKENKPVEKNWSPFVGYDESGEAKLMFEYTITPRSILSMENTQIAKLNAYVPPHPSWLWRGRSLNWPNKLGDIRGGTPGVAIKEGGCLAFFHSMFCERDVVHYVMGAYTYQNTPPYSVKSIFPIPLLFDEMYDTPTPRRDLKVIYPTGFVVQNENGKEVIQLVCGENDRAIRLVSIDKAELLKRMRPVRD